MTREWTTKTFKSCHSLAIRLPKATEIRESDGFVIVDHEDATFDLRRLGSKAATLDARFGGFSPVFTDEGRGDTELADRSWDDDRARPRAV